MRRLIGLLAVLTVVVSAPAATAATRTVSITGTGFSPRSVAVNLGDRVTWRNTDTHPHQVVADNGAFASPVLAPGKAYSHVFRAAGKYAYRDALHPARRGTVTVKGPPPSVSLGLTAPIIRFGSTTTLNVRVSVKKAGEAVTIQGTPWGGTPTTVASVSTDANGNATATVTPQQYTTYVAKWKSTSSSAVVAQVRPKISFLPYGDGRFIARVTGPRSFAGRYVYVQRHSAFGQWVTVAKWRLGPKSGRVFPLPRRRGRTTYRVYMTVNQAGTALLDGWSGTQTVRRR